MKLDKVIIPLFILYGLIVLAVNIGIIYVVLHFILKYW